MIKVFSNEFNQSIQEIKSHDHLSLIYENQDELLGVLFPFIKAGLEKGEKCIFLFTETDTKESFSQLIKKDKVVNAALESGQLGLLNKEKKALSKGDLNPDQWLSFLESLHNDSLQSGYSSIRIAEEMTWALEEQLSIAKLLMYESVLDEFFLNHPACGICQYDRKRFKPETTLQIIKTHRLIIYKQGVFTNPFYTPPSHYDSTSQAERDVNSMLSGLRNLKHWENELVTTIKNLRYLVEINKNISGTTDLDKVISEVINNLVNHTNAVGVAVMTYDPDRQDLSYHSTRGFLEKYSLDQVYVNPKTIFNAWPKAKQEMLIIPHDDVLMKKPLHLDRFWGEEFNLYLAHLLIVNGELMGVLEVYLADSLAESDMLRPYIKALVNQLSSAINNTQAYQELQQKIFELTMAYDMTIARFAEAMDRRDNRISRTAQRVAEMTEKLAREMGASEDELMHIRRGVLLKSISKMSLPDKILKKSGPLNENEWDIMHQHPQMVFDLLEDIKVLRPALEIPHCHHEHWDGSGYPRGLKGEEIPMAARQFAVVNVYDALLTDRPYRQSWEEVDAIAYIRSLSGVQFDPKVVEAFMRMIEKDI